MIFDNVNILDKLREEKKSLNLSKDILIDVHDILNQEVEQEQKISDALKSANNNGDLPIKNFNPENIFNIGEIQKICIQYRLRFLDTRYFKGQIPYEAFVKIKELEKETGFSLHNFKIIAPAEVFNLEDKNKDPLLFLRLNENQFYFIHKWGSDLSWFRRIWAYPLQNFQTFLISLFFVALLTASFIPPDYLVRSEKMYHIIGYYRAMFFFGFYIAAFFTTVYFGFTFQKNFSTIEWDSKFYNN